MTMEVSVTSTKSVEVLEITGLLEDALSGYEDGLVLVSVPHTTAALVLCEDDPGLRQDLVKFATRWLDPLQPFEHIKNENPNTSAHILSAVAGTQLILPVTNGGLRLGTYQNVLLLELDGPRERALQCWGLTSGGGG